MNVLALEPYAALSHGRFLDGLRRHSAHSVDVELLAARQWKWRMGTSSLVFARRLAERPPPDVLLASDYLNLAELLPLLPGSWRDVPAVVYFHENQLTYPLQDGERRDLHFALKHVHAVLAARAAWFNSEYHRASFLGALPELLQRAPDVDAAWVADEVAARSRVLPLGVEIDAAPPRSPQGEALVLWNHRWEYDKGPDELLAAARALAHSGLPFRLRVSGQRFRGEPAAFETLRRELGERVEWLAFAEDRERYAEVLRTSDVVLSTARHEFFGVATLEAIRSGCLPVLPDDLAYPELLPEPERTRERFLYAREDGAGPAVVRAVEAALGGEWTEARVRLVEFTDRFVWGALAGRYDAGFAALAPTHDPPPATGEAANPTARAGRGCGPPPESGPPAAAQRHTRSSPAASGSPAGGGASA